MNATAYLSSGKAMAAVRNPPTHAPAAAEPARLPAIAPRYAPTIAALNVTSGLYK
jgi:hypothetical protein